MSETTLNLMVRIERKMNRYVGMAMTHCGHDELVEQADRARTRLMKFIEEEVEKLVQKARLP